MPIYALLGATGSTGSAVLRGLLSQPQQHLTLKLFVRSLPKLRKAFPDLEDSPSLKIHIIEGRPNDESVMQECLRDVDVVIACIGSNVSTPGISIAYDTASAIVDALETHQKAQGANYHPPTIIQLRSASLNPTFRAAIPWIGQICASFCFRYIYEDLDKACKLFVSSPGTLSYIFIDPPSIHDAEGTIPTGYKLILSGKQEPVLNYADLGVAFCEVAERRAEFTGKSVGVTATGRVNETWGVLVGYMAAGAKGRIWG